MWWHTLQAYKSFCYKVQWRLKNLCQNLCFIMTTFKLEIRQYCIEDGLKKVFVTFVIFYINIELSCALKSLIYGLNTDFVTYSGCVCCRVVMHIFQFMPLVGLWVNRWGYSTSTEETHSRLFQSHSNIGRHRDKPVQKEKNIYDLVPKGVQDKRTEVLENKADRMWVSNAFFEWTHVKSSTSEGRRQCCSSFLRNLTFSVICNNMLNIIHCNKPTSLCC